METTTPETEVKADLNEDQAANEILKRWKPEAAEQKQAEQPEQEQAQADAEAEAEPQDDAEQDESEAEIDVAGEKFKVPRAFQDTALKIQAKAKEVEAGATRKFQEAADLRKAAETERAAIVEMRKLTEATADLMADHRTVARRMQMLQKADVQNTDIETLTRMNAEYMQLQAVKSDIESALRKAGEDARSKETEAMRARMEHAERVVSQRIKGWGPEMKKSLAEYAIGRGAPPQALEGITEPWMVEILADAAYGRQMREHKTTVEKRIVQTTPTLKPGASARTTPAAAKADEAQRRLQKTGKLDDAASLLLARLNARKR